MLWLADLLESQPPTGEPSARNWPARFGGRGDLIRRPYPYHDATRSSGGVTLSKCPNSRPGDASPGSANGGSGLPERAFGVRPGKLLSMQLDAGDLLIRRGG